MERREFLKKIALAAGVLGGGGLLPAGGKTAEQEIGIAVVPLHRHLLRGVDPDKISYMQDPREAIASILRGESSAAFLLPPPDKEAFARFCRGGGLLPQKSTYFYPKASAGLVMRSVDGEVS